MLYGDLKDKDFLIREKDQRKKFSKGICHLLERDDKSAWHRLKKLFEICIILSDDLLQLCIIDSNNN